MRLALLPDGGRAALALGASCCRASTTRSAELSTCCLLLHDRSLFVRSDSLGPCKPPHCFDSLSTGSVQDSHTLTPAMCRLTQRLRLQRTTARPSRRECTRSAAASAAAAACS